MTDENDEWIYNIVPHDQVESIKKSMQRINEDEATLFNIVLCAPRSSAIELCKTFNKAIKGNFESTVFILNFMHNIVEMIEEELQQEGINPYEN